MSATIDPCQFAERLLMDAVQCGASDVYLIPGEDGLAVRRRERGVENRIETISRDAGERVVARLKVLAGLPGYIKTEPQSGSIHHLSACPGAEWRLSIMPTRNGERVAIRVVTAEVPFSYPGDLGLPDSVRDMLNQSIRMEAGLTILTGPTGCGKTTTVYALVREILRRENCHAGVMTLEDPIEQILPGVSQTAVRVLDGFGYAEGLRAALRQDVKTLVIGEMRDPEVVRVALDAALSGHRIITTYHAGDVASVFARMLHHGAGSYLVAGAVAGVFTQRLIPVRGQSHRRVAAAGLLPDDAWCEFMADGPGLARIRKRLEQDYPEAVLPGEIGGDENDEK
jgi:type II secretory ATPase GspE/PulE/Tfp pilus assembly ATPase PilB-like protein